MRRDINAESAPRVLYVVTEDWYFHNHRLAHARLLIEAGFEVHVATRVSDRRHEIEAAGVVVHEVGINRSSMHPLALISEFRQLSRVVRSVRPAVVHCVALKPVLLGVVLALVRRQGRVILAVSGLGLSSVSSPAKVRAIAWCLRAAARSPRVRLLFQNPIDRSIVGAPAERTCLIPGVGVDTSEFKATPMPVSVPFRFVFLGRAVRSKGLLRLPEAASALAGQGIEAEFHLFCTVDAESPGALTGAEVETLKSCPAIVWRGPTRNPASVFTESHAAFLPTEGGEGVSKFVLEGLAAGRPILTTSTAGSEILEDGVTGILFAPADTQAMVNAVVRFARLSDEDRARMGDEARATAERSFALDVLGPQVVELHRSMMVGT